MTNPHEPLKFKISNPLTRIRHRKSATRGRMCLQNLALKTGIKKSGIKKHKFQQFVTAPCHQLVTITGLSRFFRDKDVPDTTLSDFFKSIGVTVTSLSRLVYRCPCISDQNAYFLKNGQISRVTKFTLILGFSHSVIIYRVSSTGFA